MKIGVTYLLCIYCQIILILPYFNSCSDGKNLGNTIKNIVKEKAASSYKRTTKDLKLV